MGTRRGDLRNDWESEFILVGEPDRAQQDTNPENTSWDLHENGVECSETETFGDDTTKSTNTTRRSSAATTNQTLLLFTTKRDSQVHCRPHISLWIAISFSDLGPLPFRTLCTGIILSQSLERDETIIASSKEFGGGR